MGLEMGNTCSITLYIHAQAVYVGEISAFVKVLCSTLAEEME